MLHKISLKAVIIGAVADVGGSNIWGVILGIYLFAQHQVMLLPPAEQTARLLSLMQDPAISSLNLIIGGSFSVLGGYIAARIAKHDKLLNATLASFLCVLFVLLAIGTAPLHKILIGVVGNPVLCFAGGLLASMGTKKKK